jgi:Rrf2 family iron-sulfur cluster assembly transcriptional regulator
LVASVRGPGGGYCLAKPMEAVSVADIIRAVDEPLDATSCGGKRNCHDENLCMTHVLWTNLNTRMFEYLSSVNLAELVRQQRPDNAPELSVVERPARRTRRSVSVAVAA